MDPDIVPFDLRRMFLGDLPLLFYAEALVRSVIIYLYTLALVRWIGGRGVAQLSLVEFVLVIALGSAVGDAMFYPDVPLVLAMAVVTIVVVINKLLDRAIVASPTAKVVIDGRPVALVRDGALVCEGLAARDLGTNEVKAMLRLAGISNLGQVEHAWLEVNGAASVFRAEPARPGLRIVPPADVWPIEPLVEASRAPKGLACCADCGHVTPAAAVLPDVACANCGATAWVAPDLPESAETVGKT